MIRLRRNQSLAAVSFLAALILAGCAAGPDYQKPVIETPRVYANETLPADSVINLRWWELFNDPVLDTLVVAALRENRNVLIAASRIEEARAMYGFTKADILPKLDIEAGAMRGNFLGGMKTESETNNFYIAPVLSWEIDFWGKLRRANEAAMADLMSTEFSYRGVQISLITEVVGTYFSLQDFHNRLAISRRTLDSRLISLNIIQQRFDNGIIPEIDLNQSQIQKEIAAAAIPVYERMVAKTENTLSVLLGRLPASFEKGVPIKQQPVPPEIPAGLPSTLLQRRPDIMEAEFLLQAQNARIGVAEAMRLPSISITGLLGVASQDLSTLTSGGAAWSISGSLFGPLFNFGKNLRRVDIETERTLQALYHYENTVLNAFRDVENSLVDVRTLREQISAVDRKLVAARSAANLSMDRYDKGVTSYLEVQETERTLFSVELELSELDRLYFNSFIRLYKSLGGGWVSPDEEKQAQAQAADQK